MANNQARENVQNFLGERATWDISGVAGDASKTREESDVQNGGEVKNHLAKCRLVETCYFKL